MPGDADTSAAGEAGAIRPLQRAVRHPAFGLAMLVVGVAIGVLATMAGLDRDSGISDRQVVEFGEVPAPAPLITDYGVSGPEQPLGADPAPPAVDVVSGAYDEFIASLPAQPARLVIESIDVDAVIEGVGYDRATGLMDVPEDDAVGWFHLGARPGDPQGSAVVTAHVDWNGREGAFYDLHRVGLGAAVHVEFDDGTVMEYRTVAARQYEKGELPVDDLFRRDGEPVLALITCGGEFLNLRDGYEENVVLYAVPVSSPESPAA